MPMYEPGRYVMSDIEVGKGETKRGTPYIYLEGVIKHRKTPDGWEKTDLQEKRTVWLYLSDAAMQYTAPKLDALKFNGDFDNPAIDPPNGMVEVECRHDTYDGVTRDKWEVAGGGGGIDHKQMSKDKARDVRAKFLKALSDQGVTPQAADPADVPADDDIPF